MKKWLLGVADIALFPANAFAQHADDIVVIGEGLPLPPGTPAYGSVTIERERLTNDASSRIENVLRDIAGFAQFRRSDSRSANPSGQGATLRALGFGTSPVILSSMFESLVLALVGGAVGAAAAYFAFNGFQASTINWQTFSQIAFAFSVTPKLLIQAIVCAAVIGLIGGLFPAIRAARLPIAAALRET